MESLLFCFRPTQHVEVISTGFCHKRLTDVDFKFAVEPKVLCVAFNHTYHTQWYDNSRAKISSRQTYFFVREKGT